eukprot:jgi/Chlat1/4482/Chrsp29S04422
MLNSEPNQLRKMFDDPRTVNAVSGAMAGSIAAAFVCPFDVVKTRLQVQRVKQGQLPKFHGLSSSMSVIFREEGVRGLYRGLTPTMVALLPNWAVYFTVYDGLRSVLGPKDGSAPSTAVNVASAAGAGSATVFTTNPLWVVKTRMQTQALTTQPAVYTGMLQALTKIAREEGFAGLYSGVLPSVVGIAHVVIQFPLYEAIKVYLADKSGVPVNEVGAGSLAVASALSKMLASTATYPHEVIRARLQNQSRANGMKIRYTGVMDCIRKVWQEGGMHALYRGCGTNLIRTVPTAVITFTSFELISRTLKSYAASATDSLMPKGFSDSVGRGDESKSL